MENNTSVVYSYSNVGERMFYIHGKQKYKIQDSSNF